MKLDMKKRALLLYLQTNILINAKEKFLVGSIIIITLFQLVMFYKNTTYLEQANKITLTENIQLPIGINEINKELGRIENIKINNQSLVGYNWKSNIRFTGNSDMLINSLNSLKLLNNYYIINYSIDGNSQNINLNMEIIR